MKITFEEVQDRGVHMILKNVTVLDLFACTALLISELNDKDKTFFLDNIEEILEVQKMCETNSEGGLLQ